MTALPATEHAAGLDTRLEEALCYVLAHPCNWLFKMERRGGKGTTAIRSHTWTDFAPPVRPPVDWVCCSVESVTELFQRYLAYICEYAEPRYHPTSVNTLQVLRASAQAVEAEALALGVAIESVIHRDYGSSGEPPPGDKAEVDELLRLVADAPVSEHMKHRASRALERIKEANAEGSLRHRERDGHVSGQLIDAWRRVRHPPAHGKEIPGPLDETVHLCDKAHLLFNLLIFSRIGYTGEYMNRTMPKWQVVFSKPFWEPPTRV